MKKDKKISKKDNTLAMSIMVEQQPTVENTILPIDEDTSFDIIYDIYDGDKSQLYIKLQEKTALAPFFYNRSYNLEELHNLHKLFKICDSIEEVKEELKKYFDSKVIKLEYSKNKESVLMKIDVTLGVTKYTVDLELYKEMIPISQKDSTLMTLYGRQKAQLSALKDILELIDKEKNTNKDACKAILDIIKKKDIPGLELH